MVTTLKDKMKTVSAPRRKRIETRASELVAEEMSLRELRHAYRLTQQHIAAFLGIGQEGVSRLEKRSDLLISTLCGYVEALGGQLRLVAEFPNRPPIFLTELTAMGQRSPAGGRAPMKGGEGRDEGVHLTASISDKARAWLHDPTRPKASCDVLRRWRMLLDDWTNDESMPILIRKSSMNRGSIYEHPSGLRVVPADNSPANWSLSAAIEGIVPTLEELSAGLRDGTIPIAFALKQKERPHAVFKGLLRHMENPPCLNRLGWKVCHIDSVVREQKRQSLKVRTAADLKKEMKRFLDPGNMFVVHLNRGGLTYGLGEQLDFIKVFREAREKAADRSGTDWCSRFIATDGLDIGGEIGVERVVPR